MYKNDGFGVLSCNNERCNPSIRKTTVYWEAPVSTWTASTWYAWSREARVHINGKEFQKRRHLVFIPRGQRRLQSSKTREGPGHQSSYAVVEIMSPG